MAIEVEERRMSCLANERIICLVRTVGELVLGFEASDPLPVMRSAKAIIPPPASTTSHGASKQNDIELLTSGQLAEVESKASRKDPTLCIVIMPDSRYTSDRSDVMM